MFCGIIDIVHSDDSFRIVVSATPILSQNSYYGYSFLKIFTLMSIATSFYNAPKLKKSAENGERTACFTFSADFYFCKNTLSETAYDLDLIADALYLDGELSARSGYEALGVVHGRRELRLYLVFLKAGSERLYAENTAEQLSCRCAEHRVAV